MSSTHKTLNDFKTAEDLKANKNVIYLTEEITANALIALSHILDATISDILDRFKYVPKDSPFVRRKGMVTGKGVKVTVISQFWVIMLIRGGNAKRLVAGLDQTVKENVVSIFSALNISHARLGTKGLFTTWQVMASFFEVGMLIVAQSAEIRDKLFRIGNASSKTFAITVPIPAPIVTPGAFHALQHVDKVEVEVIARHVMAYNILVIYVKGILANLNVGDIKTLMLNSKNKEARKTQMSYLLLAATPNSQNFPIKDTKSLFDHLHLDFSQCLANKTILDWDFVGDPLKYVDEWVKVVTI